MAGRKPGGPKTGGRKAGTPNKVTADVRAAAQQHTATAIETLANIMASGDSDAARVSAAREILDRGHGKSMAHMAAVVKTSLEDMTDEELNALDRCSAAARSSEG